MVLELKNIEFKVDKKKILDNLSLKIKKKQVYCVIGKNGAGKSSLSKIIIGSRKAKGEIIFNDEDISKLKINERVNKGISIAWQKPSSIEGVTVEEYIKLGNDDCDACFCLKSVGLIPRNYLDRMLDENLSGGERKKIELASVIGMNSKLVILDEPDSGIDEISLLFIKRIIKLLKKQGKSVLLITHRSDIVFASDKAGILCKGKIIEQGHPRKIYNKFRNQCNFCNEDEEL